MKLIFPPGMPQYIGMDGTVWRPDASGQVDIGPRPQAEFVNVGFLPLHGLGYGTTAQRPALAAGSSPGLATGQTYFDSTLGKPIWRNAANNGWVDATGAAV